MPIPPLQNSHHAISCNEHAIQIGIEFAIWKFRTNFQPQFETSCLAWLLHATFLEYQLHKTSTHQRRNSCLVFGSLMSHRQIIKTSLCSNQKDCGASCSKWGDKRWLARQRCPATRCRPSTNFPKCYNESLTTLPALWKSVDLRIALIVLAQCSMQASPMLPNCLRHKGCLKVVERFPRKEMNHRQIKVNRLWENETSSPEPAR